MVEDSAEPIFPHSGHRHGLELASGAESAARAARNPLPASVNEQLNRRLYHSPWPAMNTAAGAIIIAGIAARVLPAAWVLCWLAVTLGVSLGRFVAYRTYRRLPAMRRGDACWSDLFVRLMAGHGLSFGAAGMFMFLTDDLLTHLTIVMTVVGLGAGVAAIYAADVRVVVIFIACAFIPVGAAALAQFDMLHAVAALLLALLGGNLMIIGRNSNRSLIHTLMLRHDREELAQALIAEKTRTELASRAKSDFLATMSHELRTPLNAIIGFSEVMLEQTFGPLGTPRYVEYCTDIHASAQHLLSLINDILDSAKVEAGKYDLHEEPTSLSLVIEASARLMRAHAAQKGIALVLALGPVPTLIADERALRQIVLNLLSNAIKFTPGGGTVTLATTQSEDGTILLEVRDTGIGIPAEDLAHVLNHFSRASNAHLSSEGGTGLGLPIARGLVVLHGGELRIASEPGAGTVVTVELPVTRIMPLVA
jgi:signal transduction histidine kinase